MRENSARLILAALLCPVIAIEAVLRTLALIAMTVPLGLGLIVYMVEAHGNIPDLLRPSTVSGPHRPARRQPPPRRRSEVVGEAPRRASGDQAVAGRPRAGGVAARPGATVVTIFYVALSFVLVGVSIAMVAAGQATVPHAVSHPLRRYCPHVNAVPVKSIVTGEILARWCADCDRQLETRAPHKDGL